MQSTATIAFLSHLRDTSGNLNLPLALSKWKEVYRANSHNSNYPMNEEQLFDGLINIFDERTPPSILTMGPRPNAEAAEFMLGLPLVQRMQEGSPSTVTSLYDFKKNWTLFGGRILRYLQSLANLVVAGGAVEACLAPDSVTGCPIGDKAAFFLEHYGGSDIDLFTYNLDDHQILEKAEDILEALMQVSGRTVLVSESAHSFSFDAGWPWRKVQLIKHRYRSPAHILESFDLDAPCSLYTGSDVWCSPRAIVAMATCSNELDWSRAGHAYEIRMVKYALRGYRVYWDQLRLLQVNEPLDLLMAILAKAQGLALLRAFDHKMSQITTLGRAMAWIELYRRIVSKRDDYDYGNE